jgi:hypothetical protein
LLRACTAGGVAWPPSASRLTSIWRNTRTLRSTTACPRSVRSSAPGCSASSATTQPAGSILPAAAPARPSRSLDRGCSLPLAQARRRGGCAALLSPADRTAFVYAGRAFAALSRDPATDPAPGLAAPTTCRTTAAPGSAGMSVTSGVPRAPGSAQPLRPASSLTNTRREGAVRLPH